MKTFLLICCSRGRGRLWTVRVATRAVILLVSRLLLVRWNRWCRMILTNGLKVLVSVRIGRIVVRVRSRLLWLGVMIVLRVVLRRCRRQKVAVWYVLGLVIVAAIRGAVSARTSRLRITCRNSNRLMSKIRVLSKLRCTSWCTFRFVWLGWLRRRCRMRLNLRPTLVTCPRRVVMARIKGLVVTFRAMFRVRLCCMPCRSARLTVFRAVWCGIIRSLRRLANDRIYVID